MSGTLVLRDLPLEVTEADIRRALMPYASILEVNFMHHQHQAAVTVSSAAEASKLVDVVRSVNICCRQVVIQGQHPSHNIQAAPGMQLQAPPPMTYASPPQQGNNVVEVRLSEVQHAVTEDLLYKAFATTAPAIGVSFAPDSSPSAPHAFVRFGDAPAASLVVSQLNGRLIYPDGNKLHLSIVQSQQPAQGQQAGVMHHHNHQVQHQQPYGYHQHQHAGGYPQYGHQQHHQHHQHHLHHQHHQHHHPHHLHHQHHQYAASPYGYPPRGRGRGRGRGGPYPYPTPMDYFNPYGTARGGRGRGRGRGMYDEMFDPSRRPFVFITNCHADVTFQELFNLLEACGNVLMIRQVEAAPATEGTRPKMLARFEHTSDAHGAASCLTGCVVLGMPIIITSAFDHAEVPEDTVANGTVAPNSKACTAYNFIDCFHRNRVGGRVRGRKVRPSKHLYVSGLLKETPDATVEEHFFNIIGTSPIVAFKRKNEFSGTVSFSKVEDAILGLMRAHSSHVSGRPIKVQFSAFAVVNGEEVPDANGNEDDEGHELTGMESHPSEAPA